MGLEGITQLSKPEQFMEPGDPLPEQRRKSLEEVSCRVMLDIPFGVFSLFFDPIEKLFVLYLQPRHIVLEIVDQFFRVELSMAALSFSSTWAAAIFHDGLT